MLWVPPILSISSSWRLNSSSGYGKGPLAHKLCGFIALLFLFSIRHSHSQLLNPEIVDHYAQLYQYVYHGTDVERLAGALKTLAGLDASALVDRLASKSSSGAMSGTDGVAACTSIVDDWLGLGATQSTLANDEPEPVRCRADMLELVCGLARLARSQMAPACSPGNASCSATKLQARYLYNWTAYALDASGGASPGLLEGNRLWLGTYRECHFSVRHFPSDNKPQFRPKFCTVGFSTGASKAKAFATVCVQANNGPPIGPKSPGCAEPSELVKTVLGVCVPDSCSESDVFHMAKMIQKRASAYMDVCLSEDAVSCEEQSVLSADWRALLITCLLSLVGVLSVVGSAWDFYMGKQLRSKVKQGRVVVPGSPPVAVSGRSHDITGDGCTSILSLGTAVKISEKEYFEQLGIGYRILLAFSIQRNARKLLSSKTGPSDITCLHGLRVLSSGWVILAHTYYLLLPYIGNIASLLRIPRDPGFQLVDNATLSADTFFVLSGALVSFLWFKEMGFSKGQKLKSPRFWLWFYAHRILRIVPIYLLIIGSAMLIPHLAEGPLWRTADGSYMDIENCRQNWWSNALFLNNFVTLNNPCMPWTWYLANDMQFYVLSPVFLVLLWYFPWVGLGVSLITIVGCSVLRGVFISNEFYPPTLMLTLNPVFKQTIVDFYQSVYIKPYMRCAPYIFGLMLGFTLNRTKRDLRIPKLLTVFCWVMALILGLAVLLTPYLFAVGAGKVSIPALGFYGSIHRWVWAVGVCIVVFLCSQGAGGHINAFLSWKAWVPLSRMSYVVYLIHPLAIGIYYMQTHRAFHVDHWMMFYYFIGNTMVSYLAAFVLCTWFELPIAEVCRLLVLRARQWEPATTNVGGGGSATPSAAGPGKEAEATGAWTFATEDKLKSMDVFKEPVAE
jgi:peptidoglycan/LPS O-acetylase OafA/YrhL